LSLLIVMICAALSTVETDYYTIATHKI